MGLAGLSWFPAEPCVCGTPEGGGVGERGKAPTQDGEARVKLLLGEGGERPAGGPRRPAAREGRSGTPCAPLGVSAWRALLVYCRQSPAGRSLAGHLPAPVAAPGTGRPRGGHVQGWLSLSDTLDLLPPHSPCVSACCPCCHPSPFSPSPPPPPTPSPSCRLYPLVLWPEQQSLNSLFFGPLLFLFLLFFNIFY